VEERRKYTLVAPIESPSRVEWINENTFASAGADTRILIMRVDEDEPVKTLNGHKDEINQIRVNQSGTRLATASEIGTIVRVFDTESGDLLFDFRRGTSQAIINSISFNPESSMICVASNTGTIHIYSLALPGENKTSSFAFIKAFVPIAGDTWSSRQIYLGETHAIASFSAKEGGKHIIIALASSGLYYKYSFADTTTDCNLDCKGKFFPEITLAPM